MKKFAVGILALIMVITLTMPAMAYRPQDVVANHWALDYISPLLDEGIMYVYKSGDFKPNQAITRGEFAYSLAQAMNLEPTMVTKFTDISHYSAKGYISALVEKDIITGYPDDTFRPYNQISRAEIITMLGRSLNLDDEEKSINLATDFYFDVSQSHWASNLISLATRLNLINGYPDGNFKPNQNVTRAESAKLLAKLRTLEKVEGEIVETYPLSQKIKLKVDNDTRTFNLASNSLIGRNNRLVNLGEMLVSDNAYLLLDEYNNVAYLKAYGLITKTDIATKVSGVTNNTLSAEELLAISEGDWETVTPRLRQEVTMSLLEEGLSIDEVQAILQQDWTTLQSSAKKRLIEAISINTNLPKELIIAAYQKDWEEAKEIAQNTAITSVIQQIMSNTDLLS